MFQMQRVASFDHCCVVHRLAPSSGSSAVRTPTAFPIVAIFLVFRHVKGCVPEMIVIGPLNVPGGSLFPCVQSSRERSVVAVDESATMPTFPAASTPTVANSGLKLAPEIFAVWLTTHAVAREQSRSAQNITLLASVPCDPHPLVQGPEVSTT